MEINANQLSTIQLYKDFIQGGKLLRVLNGVSITFNCSNTYAIKGVSGSGKSTLLHLLGGLDAPTAGSVLFNGLDLTQYTSKEKTKILNQKIGFVFQFHYLIKELTAQENIMLMGIIGGQSKAQCRSRAQELLEYVGLASRADFYPGQLSGGEQQRISIARALFNKPIFLLADEPTGNLDPDNAHGIVQLFLDAHKQWNMGIIICSHDPDVYQQMEYVYTLHEGGMALEKAI